MIDKGINLVAVPIIDTKGVNMATYERDLAERKAYGDQSQSTSGVAKGTMAGATASGLRADNDKQSVVKHCVSGRGYRVLN